MAAVLICGYLGHGKDFLADRFFDLQIFDHYSIWSNSPKLSRRVKKFLTYKFLKKVYSLQRVTFATPLKEDVAAMLSMTVEELNDKKEQLLPQDHGYQFQTAKIKKIPENELTYRHILIDYGAAKREIDPDYWIKLAAKNCTEDHIAVITDYRFPNEANIGKYLGLNPKRQIKIRVHRVSIPIPPFSLPSEHELDNDIPDFLFLEPNSTPSQLIDIFPWADQFIEKVL